MKKSKQPSRFSKRSIVTILSTTVLLSSNFTIPNVKAAPIETPPNVVFSDDLQWMKPVLSINGESMNINFGTRFSNFTNSVQVSATSSNSGIATVQTSANNLAITVLGFGETNITVITPNDHGEQIVDQFQMKVTKKGDINGDGILNTNDVLQIYQVTSGKVQLNNEQLKLLDINGDGSVTNADASLLMSNYVGKSLPTTLANNFFVQLKEINDQPIAVADSYTVDEDTQLNVNEADGLLHNDYDIEGNELEAILQNGPTNGTLNLNKDGSFNFVPNENFEGIDEFSYVASDKNKSSEPVVVKLNINAQNDAPIAQPDTYTLNEDTSIQRYSTSSVTVNDTDVDGSDNLVAIKVSEPSHGTVTLFEDGSFEYIPHENYYGLDNFTYKVNDGLSDSNIANVNFNIEPVQDIPIVKNISIDGMNTVGQKLTATYQFFDVDGDLESLNGSQIQWFQGSSESGEGMTLIDGANSLEYTIRDEDLGKYLFVQVTPVAATGVERGNPVIKAVSGIVQPKDMIRPTISSMNPVNNALDIENNAPITIQFSENVTRGNGKIAIMKMATDPQLDEVFIEYSLLDPNVQINGSTVTLHHPDFDSNSKYYVLMEEGAFKDQNGNNSFEVVRGDWNFTTKSLVASMIATPTGGNLNENELREIGQMITLTVAHDTFLMSITENDFILNNAPADASILGVIWMDENTVILSIDSPTDIDQVISNFTITAKGTAFPRGESVTSNPLTISAEIEQNELFISEFLYEPNFRIAIELFNAKGYMPNANYSLEFHYYGQGGKSIKKIDINNETFKIAPMYIVIDTRFYDAFDIVPNLSYFNDDPIIAQDGKVVTGVKLLSNGTAIDTIGNPDGQSAMFPIGGTMVRQNGKQHGISKYAPSEWAIYPIGTYLYLGKYNH